MSASNSAGCQSNIHALDIAGQNFGKGRCAPDWVALHQFHADIVAGTSARHREGAGGTVSAADFENAGVGFLRQEADEIGARGVK